MKKLKTILLFSLILFIPVSIYFNQSKYKDETTIEGVVNNYEIDDSKITIELIGKEKIFCTYYLKENENINISLGDKLKLVGNLKIPKDNTNFNLFNYRKYLLSKRIYYQFEVEKYETTKNNNLKYKIKNWIKNRIEGSQNNIYLNLFILGENNLAEEVKQSYQLNGISHLFAISGMHITLFTSFILFIINKINKNKIINFLILVIFLLFYMFLTNYSPSVVRASLFFIALNIKKIFKLNITNFELIIFILLILLNYNPYYIYNTGFLYSFTVSISLILFGKNEDNYFKNLFKTSLIAFLVGIPISINNYYSINLLTPFLNIFFVPFVSFVIFPLSLINFIIPFIDPINNFLLNILEIVSLWLSKIDFLNIILCKVPFWIVIIYYIIIVWVIKKLSLKRITLLLIILLIHTNSAYFKMVPVVTMIDVGQGDSILIELPNNKGDILIDTGGIISYNNNQTYILSKNIIIPYLKSRGIKNLDYLILTHGDYDHLGDALDLLKNYEVKNVFMNSGSDTKKEVIIKNYLKENNIAYQNVSKYQLNIENYQFYFINSKNAKNENEDSLVIYTILNNKKLLFMGDAGKISENKILNTYNLENLDILKVGHHGSKSSSNISFIQKTNPKISLISCGLNNRYNHPNNEVIKNLESINSKIYITSINGMIRLTLKDKIKIETVF